MPLDGNVMGCSDGSGGIAEKGFFGTHGMGSMYIILVLGICSIIIGLGNLVILAWIMRWMDRGRGGSHVVTTPVCAHTLSRILVQC